MLGEGNDWFTIREVTRTGVIIDALGAEDRDKIYSVRYPPRPPSYRKDKPAAKAKR